MKKITRRSFLAAMGTSAAALALTACGGGSSSTAASTAGSASGSAAGAANLSGSITFTIWDNNLMTFIDENDMVGKFQEVYPDADIEVEKIKDDSEYWNAMKMRASANQLQDVMFTTSLSPCPASRIICWICPTRTLPRTTAWQQAMRWTARCWASP